MDSSTGPVGFAAFAAEARPALVRLAQANGRDDDAEDAVQAALVGVMRAWPRLAGQPLSHLHAYARRAVTNTCRTQWRRYGSRIVLGDVPEGPAEGAVYEGPAYEDRAALREAVARLPLRQRTVLWLRYAVGLPDTEIAERVGCSPITVRTASARGLRSLRAELAT